MNNPASQPTELTHPWLDDDWQSWPEAQEGMRAWRDGKPHSACPYPRGFKRIAWQDGWNLEADNAVGVSGT